MTIQLWSYNYDPEPTGIGPVSRTWAKAMTERGHEIHVIAAHPHYPEPVWGSRRRPYTEWRDGIKVTRLPLWIGRENAKERIRQEASFAAWQTAYLPLLGGTDAVVAVSPCFPALAPAILNRKVRRKPLILWIQDILPDGAVSTGIVDDGIAIRFARHLEKAAYVAADRIVVISDRFKENLLAKGVPTEKLTRIYNPATRPVIDAPREFPTDDPPRVLVMGNIGHSQGLDEVVRAFESSLELEKNGARLVIAGTGVAETEVRAAITTDRVEMLGLVSDERLNRELAHATIGLVSQRSEYPEFNMPSKLMNYFAAGLPVVASVGVESEVKRVVDESGAGAVCSGGDLGRTLAEMIGDREGLARSSEAARLYTSNRLTSSATTSGFEALLVDRSNLRD
ncbi:MAG: glycosyltransferase family 4 protein [Actinobacteria bacterium]|nr:glycosyltransferase family 4 protein [Actinomycetota bacterium]